MCSGQQPAAVFEIDSAVLLNALQPVFNTLTREAVFTASDQFLSHWAGTSAGQLPASFQHADQGVLVDGFPAATDEIQLGWMTGDSRRCRTCCSRGVFWRATPETSSFFPVKTSLKWSHLCSSLINCYTHTHTLCSLGQVAISVM